MASPNIAFSQIPANVRKPGTYLEEDVSNALTGLTAKNDKVVLIAQQLATGSVTEKVPTKVFSDADASLYFGAGSIAHLSAKAALEANPYIDLTVVGVSDNGTTKAAGAIAIASAATASGSIDIWIGDVLISTSVASGDAAVAIATAIKANIDAVANTLPVIAGTLSTSTIPITAKNAGTLGNYIAMSYKIRSVTATTVTLTQLTAGATDPDVGVYSSAGTVLASIVAGGYTMIISTLSDATNYAKIKSMIEFVSGPMEQRPCVGVIAYTDEVGTLANAKTLCGTTLNHGRTTCAYISYASDNIAKTEVFKIAGAYGAEIAVEPDPARPLDSLPLYSVAPPAVIDRLTRTQQEDCLNNGVTPLQVGPGELVQIVRAISTYVTNSLGIADPTLLDITTIRTLDYVRDQIRTRIAIRFARQKLSTRTPKAVRSQVLDVLYLMEQLEIVENVDYYKSGVIVERDTSDTSRLNVKCPSDIVNGLHCICGVIDLIL